MLVNVSAYKKIALKLYNLNWFERHRLLKVFTVTQKQKIKHELSLLKQMKVKSIDSLLAQTQEEQEDVNQELNLLTNCGFSAEVLVNINTLLLKNKRQSIAPAMVESINEFAKQNAQGGAL